MAAAVRPDRPALRTGAPLRDYKRGARAGTDERLGWSGPAHNGARSSRPWEPTCAHDAAVGCSRFHVRILRAISRHRAHAAAPPRATARVRRRRQRKPHRDPKALPHSEQTVTTGVVPTSEERSTMQSLQMKAFVPATMSSASSAPQNEHVGGPGRRIDLWSPRRGIRNRLAKGQRPCCGAMCARLQHTPQHASADGIDRLQRAPSQHEVRALARGRCDCSRRGRQRVRAAVATRGSDAADDWGQR